MARMWYYSRKDEQEGPVSFEKLCRMARDGLLRPNDLVWQEGTADWKKAKQVANLFEDGSGGGVATATDIRSDEAAPRRRAARSDFDDDEPRPARKRRKEKASSNKGLVIGLSIGGGALLLIGVVVIIIVATRSSGEKAKAAAPIAFGDKKPPDDMFPKGMVPGGALDTFTFENLNDGDVRDRQVFLKGGRNVEIRVESTVLGGGFGRAPDVDLFVIDPAGNEIAMDTAISKDCFVSFFVPRDGNYRVEVENLGPGRVHARVTIR